MIQGLHGQETQSKEEDDSVPPINNTEIKYKNNEEAKVITLNIHKNSPVDHAQHMETHLSCHSGEFYSTLGNNIKADSICMI